MARKHSKDHASGPTHAIEELNEAGVPFVVHEYEHDPSARAYGEETVEKLGIDPAIAFKTLMVKLEPTGEFVVGADPAVAQRRTGYVVGGISPLGQTTKHRIFIDSSCLDHETMLVSGGRRGVSVELSPLDLAEIVGAEVVDLAAQA